MGNPDFFKDFPEKKIFLFFFRSDFAEDTCLPFELSFQEEW